MPTYSYKCTECGTAFDIHQSFTDDSLTVCPSCGGRLRKVFSPVGITFNGSGFYRTDSRAGSGSVPASHGERPAAKAGKGADASGGSAASGAASAGGSGSAGSSGSAGASGSSGASAPSTAASGGSAA